jgi:hypothetical protein
VAAAGLVSMWGLFNAQLLYASRIPFVMARDGWLPAILAQLIVAVTVLVATVRDRNSYGQQLLLIAVSVLSGIALYLTRLRQVEAKRPTSIA